MKYKLVTRNLSDQSVPDSELRTSNFHEGLCIMCDLIEEAILLCEDVRFSGDKAAHKATLVVGSHFSYSLTET